MSSRQRVLWLILALGACADSREPGVRTSGPMGESLVRAAKETQVPAALLVAIAQHEGGLRLAMRRVVDPLDEVPVGGALELRHGAFDSLARGAQLMDVDEDALRMDTDLGTRAGARVLAELGARHGAKFDDLKSWRAALEELSGLPSSQMKAAYASDVFELLRKGGTFRARDGEWVTLRAHGELDEEDGLGVARQALNTPQVPGAIWFDTSCTNGKCSATRNAAVSMILIHDTEGGWVGSVATLQNDAGKSVHYIIDADGSRVGQFLLESYRAYHAGNSYYNHRTIGIEHVGFAADGFEAALYDKSVEVVQNIATRNGIPIDRQHIIGHYQVPDGGPLAESDPPCPDYILSCIGSTSYGGASNHHDPGTKWQWCQYMEKLGGTCECEDAHPHFNCTTDLTQAYRCSASGVVEMKRCQSACVVEAIGQDDTCIEALVPGMDGGADLADVDGGSRGGDVDVTVDGGAGDIDAGDLQGTAPSGDFSGGCRFADGGGVPSGAGVLCGLFVLARCVRSRRRRWPSES